MTEKDDPGEGTNEIPSRESVIAKKSMSGEMAMPSLQMSGVALNVLSKQVDIPQRHFIWDLEIILTFKNKLKQLEVPIMLLSSH